MTDLKAGRELDALVAEKVMGWPHEQMLVGIGTFYDAMHLEPSRAAYRRRSHVDRFWERWSPSGSEVVVSDTVPSYSTDIAAAWEVVEHLPLTWWPEVGRMQDGSSWYCELCLGSPDPAGVGPAIRVVAATAPLAICLAALKAVGA